MGLILDSSVAIAAERRGDTVEQLVQHVIDTLGDQDAALSAIGVAELVHGIYRAESAERRRRRESFVEELLSVVTVYPLTIEAARLTGGSMQSSGAEASSFRSRICSSARPLCH